MACMMSSIFTDSFSSEDDISMVIDDDNIIAVKDTRTPTNAMKMLNDIARLTPEPLNQA